RQDGIPKLVDKFKINLARQFPTRQQQRILEVSRRRQDGIPKLVDKFKINLARQFPTRQQQRILEVS
ncbi:hypothetical protein CQA09_29530, partial [Klebsiella pneumoniae]